MSIRDGTRVYAGQKECAICMEHPPTIMFEPCGHVILCSRCSRVPKLRSVCVFCEAPVENVVEHCEQKDLYPATIRTAIKTFSMVDSIRRVVHYDNGEVKEEAFHDMTVVLRAREQVRQAMVEERSIEEALLSLAHNLTLTEYEAVTLAIALDVDLHPVTEKLIAHLPHVQVMNALANLYKGTDDKSVLFRAGVTTGVRTGILIAPVAGGWIAVGHLGAFVILSGIEIARYIRGDLTRQTLLLNLAEHFSGCVAGGVTGTASAIGVQLLIAIALAAGGPPSWVVIGGGLLLVALCSMLADFLARKGFRTFVNTRKLISNSAKLLGINLKKDDFTVAKCKFRGLALKTHPDKLPPTATEEERQKANFAFAELIAAWQLVREHFAQKEKEERKRQEQAQSRQHQQIPPRPVNSEWSVKLYVKRVGLNIVSSFEPFDSATCGGSEEQLQGTDTRDMRTGEGDPINDTTQEEEEKVVHFFLPSLLY